MWACLLDRAKSRITFMVSTEGGMDIEKVAEETPEKIYKVIIDPTLGLGAYQARQLSFSLNIPKEAQSQAVKIFLKLYQIFIEKDCELMEINPLVITKDKNLLCLDCKISIDDNALYRQPLLSEQRDWQQEDQAEAEAMKNGLSFVKLNGSIACLVNGAGLAMATMDVIQLHGGRPANFLDVGGGASQERIEKAIEIILKDPSVKGILICIFGGIMKCDLVAQALVHVFEQKQTQMPIVVRFDGTHADKAKDVLKNSSLNYQSAQDLKEAAEKIVKATS